MDYFEKIFLYLIPLAILVWIVIGIFIVRRRIEMNIDHSPRLKRGLRRLDLGKTGSAGAD